jgi:CheY-like chemotaxis protein
VVSNTTEGLTTTVLVVDDQELVREVAARFLKTLGFRVLRARDGVEALEIAALEDQPPSLVVTDIQMPRMGGWELGARLRERYPRTAVLYMSAFHGGDLDVERGVVLAKPFSYESFSSAVRRAMVGSG